MIEVTRREMERAHRDHCKAFTDLEASNSGLTCLFYAAECGLKSLIMKRERQETTAGITHYELGHDINKMLSHLRCEKSLLLPGSIPLEPLKTPKMLRNAAPKDLNQVWRYGLTLKENCQTKQIAEKLNQVCQWVKEQR